MDKLKPIWKMIKKYHVWVLCMVMIGSAVGGLFAANAGLEKSANKSKGEIDRLKADSDALKRKPNPPNQAWLDEKDKQIDAERARIRRIWEKIYERQQRKLIWPKKLGGLEFVSQLEDQAAETRLIKEHEDLVEKYTSEVFDDLLALVKAEANYTVQAPVVDDAPVGRARKETKAKPNTISPVRTPYVVGWLSASQSRIRDPLMHWGDENKYGRPTKNRVLAVQRKIWIYGSMLSAIAKTNGKATANYMANVKHILDLQVGKDVQPLQQRVAVAKTPKTPVKGRPNVKPKTPRKTPVRTPASQPRSSFSGIEYVAVRMDLMVDQRHISTLLSELANAPLPIEITNFSMQYQPRQYAEETTRDHRNARTADTGPILTIVDSYDMRVAIEGKVHFYKAPDDRLLGTPNAAP